jgi:hypothetical protein
LSVLLQALVHPLDRLLVRHLAAHERTATRFLHHLCTFRNCFFLEGISFLFVCEPNKNISNNLWIDASIESRERERTREHIQKSLAFADVLHLPVWQQYSLCAICHYRYMH